MRRGIIALIVAVVASGLVAMADHGRLRPKFTLEQITQTRTLGQFAISPDGTKVVATITGHYFHFPLIPRFGEDNNVKLATLATGEIRRLTTGAAPKIEPVFSPRGDWVAYESEGDIWVVEVATGVVRRVTIDLAADRAASWSPDGTRLAFVSNRTGRTELWSTAVEGERHGLVQLTNDVASEDDPQWSRDGKSILFEATRPDEHLYAIGLYSIPAGGGRAVRLSPTDASTNFAARWSPDGTSVAFLSDRSGYIHVWTMKPDGTGLREFATGSHDSLSPYFRVQPVWSPKGDRIQIPVNRNGSFDLALLDVASGSIKMVGEGGGRYHEVGWSSDGALVYGYENAWSPPDLFVQAQDTKTARQLTHSSHASFRKEHFAKLERVSIKSFDGLTIHGFLYTPNGLGPNQRLPGVLVSHPNAYGQFYDFWNPFFHYLVESGYVMLVVDQRGSAGYGRAFREAGIGAWGTKTLEDIKAAAAFLKAHRSVEPDKVGMMGLSHGGYHTLLALTKVPTLFHAGIDLMGPADRRSPFSNRNTTTHIGGSEKDNPDLYDRVSPITSVKDLRAPLLILHSDRDRNALPGMTYNFVDELERHHKVYEVVYYPDEAHGLADIGHQLDSYRRIVAFFDRWLKP